MLSTDHHLEIQNDRVRLVPLSMSHIDGLLPIVGDESIWRWSGSTASDKNALTSYIQNALKERSSGVRYPFAIFDREKGKIAGSTSFGTISNRHKRVEIGWTWLGKEFQRTGLNRNAKFVMLSFGFEQLAFERIEFKTDLRNEPSRIAIQAIGATEEGVLRSHIINWQGTRRDTIYYSILANEWPQIKATIFKNYAPLDPTEHAY